MYTDQKLSGKERILRMRGLFTFRYSEEQMKTIEYLGIEITYIPEETLPAGTSLAGYDFLVCFNPFARLDYTDQKLKWIHLVSKGVGHVPKFLQDDPDIIITNNVSGPSVPIGELIICYILEIFKNSRFFYERQREKVWQSNPDILEITGKKICFLGTGLIAREAAARLRPWNATLIGLNTSGHEVPEFDQVLPMSKLTTVLPKADVVISALPATPETFHLLNAETLKMIPAGASLINISRGSVIDEKALCELVAAGHFRGVALDVFENEPLPAESPLWSDERVIVTPHNALYSDWYGQRVFDGIYENAGRFLAGDELCGVVDFKKGY